MTNLSSLEKELKLITTRLSDPKSLSPKDHKELARKHLKLTETVAFLKELKNIDTEITKLREIINDAELAPLAREEISSLENKKAELEKQAVESWMARDPWTGRNVFIEIRAGVGGDEAALFAGDLLKCYERYAASLHLAWEIIDARPTGIGGIKEAIAFVRGKKAYTIFKWESGVHRIQRVPRTESSGRVHTSTATVAILPETAPEEVKVDTKDLRIDTFRAGGHGGQNVNKVESAVRITHIPSNIVVVCQQERSQLQNREKAMKILVAKLGKAKQIQEQESVDKARRVQIGSADRSEKIRTYNLLQSRVTDHRINESFYNFDEILSGKLDTITQALQNSFRQQKLDELRGKDKKDNS
ncbi:peptide chain release factor 1 [Elusimicrobiota bacterium]